MKTAGAVRHKLSQVRFRYLKRKLELDLAQQPENCKYNVVFPASFSGNTHPSRVCLYGADSPMTWAPSLCDSSVDEGQRAKTCSVFCPRKSKPEIKQEFSQELESMTLPQIAYHYPDLAALIWVLDPEDLPGAAFLETEVQETEVQETLPPETPSPSRDSQTYPEVSEHRQETGLVRSSPWWGRFLGLFT